MPNSIKELIVVLAIGAAIFRLGKPIFLCFGNERDYSRRRNVWFVLTATAFLSPNFWLFTLVAAPLLVWAGRKDKNPIALYLLLLHVIPTIPATIPMPGLNSLFDLDNYRLLSICILIPAAWRLKKSKDSNRVRGITSMDLLLLTFGALQVALFIPPDLPNHVILHDSFTNILRRAFLFFIDVYIVYYAVSRACSNRQLIVEAQAAFCLACVIMAGIAVFETARHWLMYTDMAFRWSNDVAFALYKERGGSLRAEASSGNPLALGYLLAIAFGFWQYLQSHIESKASRLAVMALLLLGLLATFSRGPLIGAFGIYLVVLAIGVRGVPRLLKRAIFGLLLVMLLSQLPIGERLAQSLPFTAQSGNQEADYSISYRRRLAARSWDLIKEHPFFGDQLALQKLEDLRQGEGIIDTVNTYAEITMFYGFIGIGTFIGLLLVALYRLYGVAKAIAQDDPDFALMGFTLAGCIIGTLLMLATCSFILGYVKLFYVIAGLSAAYGHLGKSLKSHTKAYRSASFSPELR
jgi:O-antigen ligase